MFHDMSLSACNSGNNSYTTFDTIPHHNIHKSVLQANCEFNFLKRQLDKTSSTMSLLSPDQPSEHQSQAHNEQNQPNSSRQGNIEPEQHYEDPIDDQPPWKKRHIETLNVSDPSTTSLNISTNSTTSTGAFDLNNFPAHVLNDFQSVHDHQHRSDDNSDLSFNLMGSNSFINDLFSYDTNLIVPVTSALDNSGSFSATGLNSIATTIASSISYDDTNNWHSNDLLELDHRYNSSLQNDLTELTAAISENKSSSSSQATRPMAEFPNHTTTNYITSQSGSLNQSSPTLRHHLEQSSLDHNHHQQQVMQNHHHHQQQQQNFVGQQEHSCINSDKLNPSAGDHEGDFEDKNLSWLLNFKFDEFPHLSPDLGNPSTNATGGKLGNIAPAVSIASPKRALQSASPASSQNSSSKSERSNSPKGSSQAGKRFKELVLEVTSEMDGNDMIVAENVVIDESNVRAPKKPPFTYTELIEYALEDKGELTVSGIYQWISDRFPYYKSNDDRWKNSVRHNLSINPHFRKGHKAPQGAGHLWTISSGDSAENILAWEHKKQRLDLFFKMESINRERLQKHHENLQKQHLSEQTQQCSSTHENCLQDQCQYDESATAAATITQEMIQTNNNNTENKNSNYTGQNSGVNSSGHRLTTHHNVEIPFNDLISEEELRKTAGQILNGIHREVEVQSVNSIINTYHDVLLDNEDYLNPINKDVAVSESGLRHCSHSTNTHLHSQYYVTDIDPMELGIQMSHQVEHVEEEVLFNDDFNINYFTYNPNNDIAA